MTWTSPEGQRADQPIHVLPVNDIRQHVMDGLFCPCMPRLDATGNIIKHNSYDRREVGEVCRLALDRLGIALANIDHEWSADEREAYDHAIYLLDLHWPKKPTEPKP